jgi:XRE family transcriptional regulator, regulator of sulfur utilization
MVFTRRDLTMLLPALAAGIRPAGAQQGPTGLLPQKVYHSKEIPYVPESAQKKGRRFFYGATHTGFQLEMHETILGPGTQTHAPHKHEHEEIVIVVEGTMEAYMDGKTETAEAGSVVYFASNQMHSSRNIGSGPLRYQVIELRGMA